MSDRPYVFDLDGVLIDSRAAVTAAYHEAGVDMPDEAWGLPWKNWLPDLLGDDVAAAAVHDLKNQAYPRMIEEHAKPGPMCSWVRWIVEHKKLPAYVITGASPDATQAALEFVGRHTNHAELELLGCGMDLEQKSAALKRLAVRYRLGWYVDDQEGVVVPNGWTRLGVP